MAKTNDKLELACREYLTDPKLSWSSALIRAGYSESYAKKSGYKLFEKEEAQAFLQQLKQERVQRLEVDADRVIEELSLVAFARTPDLFKSGKNGMPTLKALEEIDDANHAAIKDIEVIEGDMFSGGRTKIKSHNKMQALQLLGMHFGIFDKDMRKGVDFTYTDDIGDDIEPEAGNELTSTEVSGG